MLRNASTRPRIASGEMVRITVLRGIIWIEFVAPSSAAATRLSQNPGESASMIAAPQYASTPQSVYTPL